MGLFICEFEFDQPDTKNPNYSMCEVDYYAHIPFPKQSEIPNHRLSLRKNLKTGKFEIYRHFVGTLVRPAFKDATMITDVDLKQEEVAFAGSFEDALRFGNREVGRLWGEDREPDEPCQHSYPNKATFCRHFPPYKEPLHKGVREK